MDTGEIGTMNGAVAGQVRPWKRIVFQTVGFGVGVAVTTSAVIAGWLWYSSLPKEPKSWDRSAITAEYRSMQTTGDRNDLWITYVLHNNSRFDYRLDNKKSIEIVVNLGDSKTLMDEGDRFKLVYPIFVPAGDQAMLILTLPYKLDFASPEHPTEGDKKQFENQVASYAGTHFPNLSGFSIFDTSTRYRIDLPATWRQRR